MMTSSSLDSSREFQKEKAFVRSFDHIKQHFDTKLNAQIAKILPGEYFVSLNKEAITTVLGSCVSACIRDVKLGIGGMNHFMLPVQTNFSDNWGSSQVSNSTRYGNWAMEHLINEIIKNGGKRENFEVKVIGGGKVLDNMSTDVGAKNSAFVLQYLREEGLNVANQDLGDIYPRKLVYFPNTGRTLVKKLRSRENRAIEAVEQSYFQSLVQQPTSGDVELF
jgi:chemotaxis protein CheD